MVAAAMPVARIPNYDDRAAANARLIAASPCLLAALEEVRAFYHGKTTSADEQRFMHKVWSAIAKATGGAQ
jgi:hypothetical protein